MSGVRVIVVDDHPMFRYGLRALLESNEDIEVVGEAASGEEAIELVTATDPDVVLIDLGMPGMGGLEAIRTIRTRHPAVKILVISMFEDDSILQAMQLGARGYLLKGANGGETLRAVRAVSEGGVILGASIADRLSRFLGLEGRSQQAPFPNLTEREREILDLLARGLTNAAIAERLALRRKTVRNRVSEIFDKLGVEGRSEAIVRAREAGLGRGKGTSEM